MGRVASLAGLIELCCTRRAQMNNATNNAFLVHDDSFWDTGGTSTLVARARARRQPATSTRGRDRQSAKNAIAGSQAPEVHTNQKALHRTACARMATSTEQEGHLEGKASAKGELCRRGQLHTAPTLPK